MYLIPILFLLVLFWLVIVLPQRRRKLKQTRLFDGLAVGDEVMTAGGILGRIHALGDGEVTVELAPGVNVRMAKRAIVSVVPPEEPELEPAGEDEERE